MRAGGNRGEIFKTESEQGAWDLLGHFVKSRRKAHHTSERTESSGWLSSGVCHKPENQTKTPPRNRSQRWAPAPPRPGLRQAQRETHSGPPCSLRVRGRARGAGGRPSKPLVRRGPLRGGRGSRAEVERGVPPAGVMGGGKAWITGGLGQDATKNRGESDFLYADRATGFIFTRGDRCHRSVTDGEDAPPPFRKREMIPRRRRASSRLKKYPMKLKS